MHHEPLLDPSHSVKELFLTNRTSVAAGAAAQVDRKMMAALADQPPDGLEPMTTGRWVQVVSDAMGSQSFTVEGRSFHVNTQASFFKPTTEEKSTGSDLVIYFEVYTKPPNYGERITSKTLLVQAKVGKIKDSELRCANPDLRRQLKRISLLGEGDGYLLVFTATGAYCVQVEEALTALKGNSLRTNNYDASSMLIEKVANCTAGNCKAISPERLAFPRANGRIQVAAANEKLAAYARSRDAANAFSPDHAVSITMTAAPGLPR